MFMSDNTLLQESWYAAINPNTASLPCGCLRVSLRFLSRKQP